MINCNTMNITHCNNTMTNNNTLSTIEPQNITKPPHTEKPLNDLEEILIYAIGAILAVLILQSLCFVIFIMKVERRRRYDRKRSCIPYVREPLPEQEKHSERYSSRPLKHVSDPELYESLKDLKEAVPPLPPIATLPKRKPGDYPKLLNSPTGSYSQDEDKELVNSMATRPRQPLPNELEAVQIMSKNNIFATMPRLQYPKPVPTPPMSSTISRLTNRDPPLNPRRPTRPIKPEIMPPKPHPTTLPLTSHHLPAVNHSDIRSLPKPKSPVEVPIKYSLPPEPNHEIPADTELLRKLKKRPQFIPPLPLEIPVQQITNNSPRIQPQQITQEPSIQDELMQKLKKRAALIPDPQNQQEYQPPTNAIRRVKTFKSIRNERKPMAPSPCRSDPEETWVGNFDNGEVLEQTNMYNNNI